MKRAPRDGYRLRHNGKPANGNSKNDFYGVLLICERGTTGLGHINS
jgi:hypothetical protein